MVVGANDGALLAGPLDKLVTPMRADVVERAHLVVVAERNDDRFAADVEREVVARLLEIADTRGQANGCRSGSIIVSDANTGARRLYERMGYRFVAERPMVKDDWENPGENWVLLVK